MGLMAVLTRSQDPLAPPVDISEISQKPLRRSRFFRFLFSDKPIVLRLFENVNHFCTRNPRARHWSAMFDSDSQKRDAHNLSDP
jgi:hypothetical protein